MSTSVDRALQILELLADTDKPLALTRIAERLSIPKSTAHKILGSLSERRYVVLDTAGYTVGIKAFEVGSSYVRHAGVIGVVAPQLVQVTRTLDMTSHYAVLDGADAVYLCKEDPPKRGVQLASSLGARLPSHITAVGKACLAWLPAATLSSHVESPNRPPLSASDLEQLQTELDQVRRSGYSTDDGATAMGIRCVAAPVFDVDGACGAIGVSYLRHTETDNEFILANVLGAAARTSELLGGKTDQ